MSTSPDRTAYLLSGNPRHRGGSTYWRAIRAVRSVGNSLPSKPVVGRPMPSRRIVHKSLLRCSHCRRHFQELASALIYVARRCRDRVLAVCGARIGLARGTQAVSGLMGRITGRRGGPRIRFDEILASATARTYGSLRPDRNGWSRRRASAARCCSTYSGRAAGCWPHDGVVTGGSVAGSTSVISGSARWPRRSRVGDAPIATAGRGVIHRPVSSRSSSSPKTAAQRAARHSSRL